MVQSLWDDEDAAEWAGDLGQRVYTSRLLGRDPDLVLHGGGNTSVKSRHLLGVEVTSADVARACIALCGPAFAKTTGAQIPVDGGNPRTI